MSDFKFKTCQILISFGEMSLEILRLHMWDRYRYGVTKIFDKFDTDAVKIRTDFNFE
jgi:hypothetical protein